MSAFESRLRLLIRVMAGVLAAALVALLVTLGLYLAGDDAALADGTSRWASGGGEGARRSFWLAVALSAAAIVALVAAARTGRLRIALGAVAVGGLAVALTAVTFVEFTPE